MAPTDPLLLEEAARRKLDQLMLVASKVRAGAIKGERRSTKRGTSIEFADYRNYAPGDDLRRLDWNVYARLDRPYIKLLEDEEDLAVHLLLDNSDSMDWPEPGEAPEDANKLLYARRLLAGLAYIAMGTNDRVTINTLAGVSTSSYGPARGRGQSIAMLRYMHSVSKGGITDLNASLRDYTVRARRPGLAFIATDMFSPSGYLDGMNTLLGRGYEVVLLHILSPDEITPPLAGDLRLIDVETGTAQEVSLDSGMRSLYEERVAEWRDGIRVECGRRGVHYVPIVTDTHWEKIILYDLRRLGLIK